jgi:hypothetical protein
MAGPPSAAASGAAPCRYDDFVVTATRGPLRVASPRGRRQGKAPFFTGKQRIVDVAGRVERFHREYGKKEATPKA